MALIDFIKIIRPPNAFMVTAIAVSGIWFGDSNTIWWKYVLTVVVAITYLGIAMIHNDIIDIEIDRINAPNRPLPSGRISIHQAKIYAVILFIVGTLAGVWMSKQAIILMILSLVISLLYNSKLKKLGFIGNLSVGYTATAAFLYGDAVAVGFKHFWPPSEWDPAIYLFLISAILNTSREVSKGIMDVDGDKKHGVNTIAVLYGKQNAARLVAILLVLALITTLAPIINKTFGPIFIIAVIAFLLLIIRSGIPLLKRYDFETAKKFKNQLLPNMFIALVLSIIDKLISIKYK